jgi:hypothetical protein
VRKIPQRRRIEYDTMEIREDGEDRITSPQLNAKLSAVCTKNLSDSKCHCEGKVETRGSPRWCSYPCRDRRPHGS